MEQPGTKLLGRERASAARESSPKPGLKGTRWILLAALLLLGALGSYALSAHRAVTPPPAPAKSGISQTPEPAAKDSAPMKHESGQMQGSAKIEAITPDAVEAKWGISVERLTLIADGGFVDLRYKVTDAGKASKVLDPDRPVYLLDESSGKAVTTAQLPKLGNLRQDIGEGDRPGRVYFMGFTNPDGLFETGDKVTLASGSDRLEHLTVR